MAVRYRYTFGMEYWRGVKGIGCAIGLAITSSTGVAGEPAEEPEQPIAAVQALLKKERLYSGSVDGVSGVATVAAIRRYQILHGLRATGRLDTGTLRLMLSPAPPSAALTDSDRELLRELAEAPLPDPVGARRTPIPPGDPPPVASPANNPKDGKAKRAGRSSSAKQRRPAVIRSAD